MAKQLAKEEKAALTICKSLIERGVALIAEANKQLKGRRWMVTNPLRDTPHFGKGVDEKDFVRTKIESLDGYIPAKRGARASRPEESVSRRAKRGRKV